MSAWLVVNVSQMYLPLFLLNTLLMPRTSIATVPLVVYGVGLVATRVKPTLERSARPHRRLHHGCGHHRLRSGGHRTYQATGGRRVCDQRLCAVRALDVSGGSRPGAGLLDSLAYHAEHGVGAGACGAGGRLGQPLGHHVVGR